MAESYDDGYEGHPRGELFELLENAMHEVELQPAVVIEGGKEFSAEVASLPLFRREDQVLIGRWMDGYGRPTDAIWIRLQENLDDPSGAGNTFEIQYSEGAHTRVWNGPHMYRRVTDPAELEIRFSVALTDLSYALERYRIARQNGCGSERLPFDQDASAKGRLVRWLGRLGLRQK